MWLTGQKGGGKVVRKFFRFQEVPTGMWVLSALSLAFFAFYPY